MRTDVPCNTKMAKGVTRLRVLTFFLSLWLAAGQLYSVGLFDVSVGVTEHGEPSRVRVSHRDFPNHVVWSTNAVR